MKILYDAQIFGMQDYGGISRLFSEIINRSKRNKVESILPPFIHHNDYVPDNWGFKDKLFYKNKFKNYLYTLINFFLAVPKIIFGQYDLFHPTYYETYFLPFMGKKKYVVTVFDFVHEKLSSRYPKLSQGVQSKKRKLLQKAAHIIAISENTKKDLVDIYHIDPEKVSVVHLGNSLPQWDKKKKLDLPDNYLLFVGQRWLYKNFTSLVQAMRELSSQYPHLHLVCAGGGKFTHKEMKMLKKLKLEKITHHITFSNDRDLSEIYARSTLFVYPSLYEGFGIPILEAFSAGTPIAISKASCFPEVAGNAAIYFNPESSHSVALAIQKILDDEKLRDELIKAGKKRLKLYSWQKTTQETAKVYKNI